MAEAAVRPPPTFHRGTAISTGEIAIAFREIATVAGGGRIGTADLLEQLAEMDDFVLQFDGTHRQADNTVSQGFFWGGAWSEKRVCKTAGFAERVKQSLLVTIKNAIASSRLGCL